MSASSPERGARPIAEHERSGVLHPSRLARYSAGWIAPSPDVAEVVDEYWHVSWALEDGETLDQPIIDLPAITLSFEAGDVPAALVITGVHERAWFRTISGRGTVFGIRLRPAGLVVLSDLTPEDVADATVEVTADLDPRLAAFMQGIGVGSEPTATARALDRAIAALIREREPSPLALLANDVLDELRRSLHHRTGTTLTTRLGRSERTLQRALAGTVGRGPKWVARRIRLQEAARALVTRPNEALATLAAELGYVDQSHLTSDFHACAGITPDAYRRAVRRAAAE